MQLNLKTFITIVGLALFALVLLLGHGEENQKFLYAIALGGLIVLFWLFEVVPIYVTALLPLIFAGPLGLMSSEQLASAYGHRFVFLFMGGFIVALAMEKWDVHKQIALGILNVVGKSKVRVLLGFILSTGLLSMWISNTATTLMMLPMATAVTHNLQKESKSDFPMLLMLAIAYSASIGGMGTLIGSPPNTAMAGILADSYNINVDFIGWMKIGLPLSILLLGVLFTFFVFKLRNERKGDQLEIDIEKKKWTRNQRLVLIVFVCVAILWSFRKLIIQWTGIDYGDEHVAMLAGVSLFFIKGEKKESLLKWGDTKKMAWGIIFLFGGGIALAKMLEVNGVIDEIVLLFNAMESLDMIWLLLIVVAIAIFGTEFMSNTALVSVFIPVIAAFALNAELPILMLCLPVALAASCAFMLPVGTPPNAIVFSSGDITMRQMARTGFVLNVISVLVVVVYAILFIS